MALEREKLKRASQATPGWRLDRDDATCLPVDTERMPVASSLTVEAWCQWGDMGAGLMGFLWGLACLGAPHPGSSAWWGLGVLVGAMSLYRHIVLSWIMADPNPHHQLDQTLGGQTVSVHSEPSFWSGPLFWCAMGVLFLIAVWWD